MIPTQNDIRKARVWDNLTQTFPQGDALKEAIAAWTLGADEYILEPAFGENSDGVRLYIGDIVWAGGVGVLTMDFSGIGISSGFPGDYHATDYLEPKDIPGLIKLGNVHEHADLIHQFDFEDQEPFLTLEEFWNLYHDSVFKFKEYYKKKVTYRLDIEDGYYVNIVANFNGMEGSGYKFLALPEMSPYQLFEVDHFRDIPFSIFSIMIRKGDELHFVTQ